jgi:hypothetical protein
MSYQKIYVICDADQGGAQLLSPLRPDVVASFEGMLEPNGDFVGVVYPNEPTARMALEAISGVTVLPSHTGRGKLTADHKKRLDKVGHGAHGVGANDDGYTAAVKLHGYYKALTHPESRCMAALHPDV